MATLSACLVSPIATCHISSLSSSPSSSLRPRSHGVSFFSLSLEGAFKRSAIESFEEKGGRGRKSGHGGREVLAMAEKRESEARTPEWAKPGSEEVPPWAKGEKAREGEGVPAEIPFPVYLVASALVTIAAVGSIFEYFNGNAIFGIVPPDSPLWLPILGLFAFTGFPSAAYLFYKAITGANKASREADEQDGYSD